MPAPPETHQQSIERRAQELLAQLSVAEKLALLEGDTDFWPGMVDIASRDASHLHPLPAGGGAPGRSDHLPAADCPRCLLGRGSGGADR